MEAAPAGLQMGGKPRRATHAETGTLAGAGWRPQGSSRKF